MKRLLVVANPYPPVASAGTTRLVRFLRHLPEHGWEATVLTTKSSGPADVPAGVRVLRAPVPMPRQLLGGGPRSKRVHDWVSVPDPYAAWIAPATVKCPARGLDEPGAHAQPHSVNSRTLPG